MKFQNEAHVDNWVKEKFAQMKLKNGSDFYEKAAMSQYLIEALKGGAKTKSKANFGEPDFTFDKYNNGKVAVIIENKLGLKKLIAESKEGIKLDDNSIKDYAVNGAVHYANCMIDNGKFHEVIAIGIAGDDTDNIQPKIYYVYGSGKRTYKCLENVSTLDFLENETTFDEFYKKAVLTEEEKHRILIETKAQLNVQAKSLNKLMNNHNITAPERVLYVSGMLLSMQDIEENGVKIQDGLKPADLKGIQTNTKRDGVQIVEQIQEFLKANEIPQDKQNLMMNSFNAISIQPLRDNLSTTDNAVGKFINGKASINKQIFTFIYENIYLSIDEMSGHIDIMGELYSEFLKYALGDGKELGIVLTPPYITKMMTKLLNIDMDSKVMDLATGSAGFLISAMEMMIADVEDTFGKKTTEAENKIEQLKKTQLLGVELNDKMYTLAATNMILRGDGSSNIQNANTFDTPEKLYTDFKANKLLLNPPFTHTENGMPFIEFGLRKMEKGGLGAIIIQDSAGSGKAINTNRKILKKHTLLASIKMPVDLFIPVAGVQTSIYIFEAGKPHDFEVPVRFIDFRNDGFKRTKKGINEVDNPTERYQDILKLYKQGSLYKSKFEDIVVVDDLISKKDNIGKDWNFDQHKKIDTKPTFDDFRKTVADYLAWEVDQLLKQEGGLGK